MSEYASMQNFIGLLPPVLEISIKMFMMANQVQNGKPGQNNKPSENLPITHFSVPISDPGSINSSGHIKFSLNIHSETPAQ